MANFAYAHILGNLGKDPELRYTANQTPVTNMVVATSRKRGGEETTTWWRVSLFGKAAEVLSQRMSKGDLIYLVGEPFMRKWTDRDGNEKESLELLASEFRFVGARGEGNAERTQIGNGRPTSGRPNPKAVGKEQDFDDDIPF